MKSYIDSGFRTGTAIIGLMESLIKATKIAGADGAYVAIYTAMLQAEAKLRHDFMFSDRQIRRLQKLAKLTAESQTTRLEAKLEKWR